MIGFARPEHLTGRILREYSFFSSFLCGPVLSTCREGAPVALLIFLSRRSSHFLGLVLPLGFCLWRFCFFSRQFKVRISWPFYCFCVSPIPFLGLVRPFGVWSLGVFCPFFLVYSVPGFPGFAGGFGLLPELSTLVSSCPLNSVVIWGRGPLGHPFGFLLGPSSLLFFISF